MCFKPFTCTDKFKAVATLHFLLSLQKIILYIPIGFDCTTAKYSFDVHVVHGCKLQIVNIAKCDFLRKNTPCSHIYTVYIGNFIINPLILKYFAVDAVWPFGN